MESCLLCLEINKEFVDSIKVDSRQWEELNIKNLIEKHLWVMESILPSSWLCNICWQALYDFHKFYMRVEEAHMEFGKIPITFGTQSNVVGTGFSSDDDTYDENKDLFDSHIEPEVLLDQFLSIEEATIKKEPNDDGDEDNVTLRQRRKVRTNSKDITDNAAEDHQDPLNDSGVTKRSTRNKNKKKDPKTEKRTQSENPSEQTVTESVKIEGTPQLKQEPDIRVNSPLSSDCNDNDKFSDKDYKPEVEEKKPAPKRKYKKRKNVKKNSSDSDSDNDGDSDKGDNKKNKNKLTAKQRDQFLAENFKLVCVLCQFSIDTFHGLVKHFESEHKERGYAVCCKKKFHHRSKLIEHINRHIDPSNYKCNQCGKMLGSRHSLKNHLASHLSEEDKKYPCTECGKTFAEPNLLQSHINQSHLKTYLRTCDICGRRLPCGEAFQRHMLEHEGKSLPQLKCDVCGLHVSSKHGLGRHKRMQHPVGGKKDYICGTCGKISPNSHALRQHIRVTHNPNNIHKCTMCERVFKMAIKLKEHMATHTGIALYTCPWCPKTFNASGGLHAHRKRQHPAEWEESRRQKTLEKYKTTDPTDLNNLNVSDMKMETYKSPDVTELNNTNVTDMKMDLNVFNAGLNI